MCKSAEIPVVSVVWIDITSSAFISTVLVQRQVSQKENNSLHKNQGEKLSSLTVLNCKNID